MEIYDYLRSTVIKRVSSTLDCMSIQLTSTVPWVSARLKYFLCGDSSFVLDGGNINGHIYRQKTNCYQSSRKYLKMTSRNTWEVRYLKLRIFLVKNMCIS